MGIFIEHKNIAQNSYEHTADSETRHFTVQSSTGDARVQAVHSACVLACALLAHFCRYKVLPPWPYNRLGRAGRHRQQEGSCLLVLSDLDHAAGRAQMFAGCVMWPQQAATLESLYSCSHSLLPSPALGLLHGYPNTSNFSLLSLPSQPFWYS